MSDSDIVIIQRGPGRSLWVRGFTTDIEVVTCRGEPTY